MLQDGQRRRAVAGRAGRAGGAGRAGRRRVAGLPAAAAALRAHLPLPHVSLLSHTYIVIKRILV